MFGLSLSELIVIFIVVLIVFGPEKLPEMARTMGKLFGEFKRNSDSLRREFYNTVYTPANEFKREIGQELRAVKTEVAKIPEPAAPPKTEPSTEPDSEIKKP